MRACLFLCVLMLASVLTATAGEGRIVKVLPHYLDKKGRNALSPSLYERDSYQQKLRMDPKLQSALRIDVQCKAKGVDWSKTKLRVELRGVTDKAITTEVIEAPIKKTGWFAKWNSLVLSGPAYKKFGNFAAWRVTLWEGDQQLAHEESFLWAGSNERQGQLKIEP